MMKRILSILLCLIMVLGLVPQSAQASDTNDDIYIEESSSAMGSDDAQQTEPLSPTQSVQQTVPPVQQTIPPMQLPEGDVTTPDQVACSCGVEDEALVHHSDACDRKRSCIDLCAKSAMDIYSAWYSLGAAERDFIKEYLSQYAPETLEVLNKIWASDQITDENDSIDSTDVAEELQRLPGEATAQVDDVIVDAKGIPEGSSLTVEDATKKAKKAVAEEVEDLGKNPEQLFLYDISVQNDESDDWQPEGTSVHMELTLPETKLHKYATVYVIHVDDEGNTSKIEASVTDDGAIAFETEGFSTFAGFTVDFEYGSAFYSMQGLTELKMSELFDHLHMPLYASDVVNVTFTDYSLVAVTQLEGDWLLTSLQAFNTKEKLTITMKDGTVYEIKVTDRVSPDIIVGGGGFDGVNEDYHDFNDNQEVVWHADGDGHLDTQTEHIYKDQGYSGYQDWNDGWSEDYTIYVGGSGTFYIHITPYSNVTSKTSCYVRINQVRVLKNADLIFRLADDFNSTTLTSCQIFGSTPNMFFVEDGASLTLKGKAAIKNSDGTQKKAACYLILDGRGGGSQSGGLVNTNDNQAVRLDLGATGFFAEYVRFQDCPRSAIKVCNYYGATHAKRMQTFRLNQCIFDGDVRRVSTSNTGSGGAIFVESYVKDKNNNYHYVWMDEFRLSNCSFNGCYAAESGGAIGIYAIVEDINIESCAFKGTYAQKTSGGAIVMAGHASTMTLKNCTFTNNSAPSVGGSIYIVSRIIIDANGTYSRLNELTITNCTFQNDSATSIANGQKINSGLGGAISLDSSINKVSITGCTFNKLIATEGAGLCFGYTNLSVIGDQNLPWYMTNSNFSTEENATKMPPAGADEVEGSTYYRTSVGPTTISNCEFKNLKANTQGGGIRFRTHSTVKSVSMDDVNFTSCEAVQAGSAIMLGDTIIPSLTYTNSFIKNCKTTLADSSEVGGSFRTIGKTTCNATLTKIQFLNNASHCSGGGIYWNASGTRKFGSKSVNTIMAVNQCTFDGNTAGWYGGGIYCEGEMTVTGCELKNNVAVKIGGGIALQLYNNSVRPFTDGGVTNLTLDSTTNIHHNQSKVGGGISVRANSTQAIDNASPYVHTLQFTLGGAQIHHNYAITDGGGVWFNVDSYDTSTDKGMAEQQEVERFHKYINLDSGSVYSNIAGGNGGGIFMNGGEVTDPEDTSVGTLTSNGNVTISLSGAAVYDNEAGRLATGVVTSEEDVLPPTFTITKGTDGNIAFTKSTASETGGNGGGIYLYGNKGLCSITGGVIGATKNSDGTPGTASKNSATRKADGTAGGNGGGIAIFGHGRIVMQGGYIVNNTADTAGGGLAVHDESSMYLTTGYIKDNVASMGGGVSLNNAKAYNASSGQDQDKYGLFLNGGTISGNKVIPDSTRGNIAYGGGICISTSSTAKISDGVITQNVAASTTDGSTFATGQEGGGVAVCDNSVMTFTGGTISENKAYCGGGLVLRGASDMTMTGSMLLDNGVVNEASATGVIKKNYAYQDGGGVYFGPYKGSSVNHFWMYDGWIYANDADNGRGGAVYVSKYNGFYLHDGYIEDNTATGKGGAIYCTEGVVEIYDGVIQDNSTNGSYAYGGAIAMDNSTLKIENGTIQNNKTTGSYSYGGAIDLRNSSKLNISDGIIQGNNTSGTSAYGGAISMDKSTLTIQNGTIQKNYTTGASGSGGAIYLGNASTLSIYDGIIQENYAAANNAYGGAICSNDSTVTIENGLIQKNETRGTDGRGGAVYGRKTTVTIKNGIIQNNTSVQGSGGGLHIRYGQLYFYGNADAYGSLLNNKAPKGCGGGIYGNKVDKIDIDYLYAEGNSSKYGGAVFLEACTDTAIDGGVFTKNYSNQGAGLFIRSGNSTITGGDFTYNVAGAPPKDANGNNLYDKDGSAQHGGGIVCDDLTTAVGDSWVKILGGNISYNTAPNGGGIWLKNISSTGCSPNVTMEGGSITYNTATYGGGVYVDGNGHANGEDRTVFTIKGGDISHNTANGYGGGVYATGRGEVNILENTETSPVTHGTISENKAYCGGGIGVAYGATLTVTNGYITYNTAYVPSQPAVTPATTGYQQFNGLYGAGGGVFVATGTSAANSTFRLTGESMAIYGNEAGYCADDVFSNGSKTKLDLPLVSSMNLAGYGYTPEGWVEDYNPGDANYSNSYALNMFKANGAPAELKTERYRNANGSQRLYSLLTVATDGNNYVRGNEDTAGANVASYNYANKAEAYVALTLGIPGAVDDVVVVDYGRNVNIHLIDNDLFMTEADFAASSELGLIVPVGTTNKDGIFYSSAKNNADHLGQFYQKSLSSGRLKYGVASLGNNGKMTYDLGYNKTNLTFDSPELMSYTVKHGDSWFYARIQVVPATSIYYEDNEGRVTFHTTSSKETLAQWVRAGSSENKAQDQDRPGPAMIEGLDADSIYGYDSSYASSTAYSNGSARWVQATRHKPVDDNGDGTCDQCVKKVSHTWADTNQDGKCDVCLVTCTHHCKDANGDKKCDTCKKSTEHTCIDNEHNKNYCDICGMAMGTHTISGRATFTFTGTGFDIISLCKQSTGAVMVSVYKGEVTDFDNPPYDQYVTSYMVDTRYGYVYNESTKKWTLSEDPAVAGASFYQVPVIKADLTKIVDTVTENEDGELVYTYKNYGYGTYSVELYVAPSFLEREPGYWSTDFYLDGIRIYNPAGVGNNISNVVLDAYKQDGEAWPAYAELRNMFIDQKNLGTTTTEGVIFIDAKGENITLADYTSWGPNNEIYLNPGESIAFTMDMSVYGQDVAGIHVGLRGLTGKGSVVIRTSSGASSYRLLRSSVSTTDMYYDIGKKNDSGAFVAANNVVTITNYDYVLDENGDQVMKDGEFIVNTVPLAISNIKVTHGTKPANNSKISGLFQSSLMTSYTALKILSEEDLVTPVVTPKYPALSFNGMVCYNVFFSAEELGDLTAEDLGLAVFSTEDPDGTIETAREVIYGATEINGLYMTATGGVHAKNLGDKQYFRAFAKQEDGTIVYSKMVSYSALDYAKNVLSKSEDVQLKQLVVAMLNYGAEAQKFFGYKTDDLMNASLTADDQSLLTGFDANSLNAVGKVDKTKVGAFASTGGFTKKSPAISFKGAFEINYFFTPANAVDGDMKLYFWNEDTYQNVTELTAENADKVVSMTLENGSYTASSDEIAAKYLDRTVYVAAVYESNGETYCSGVLPYSIAAYCQKPPAGVQDLATAAAIYGCTAKQYFGV